VAARFTLFMPRVLVLVLIALLTTATITFAADNRMLAAPAHPAAHATAAEPAVLLVPDVRGQVYVFAKGTLEEAGFAWRVTGQVAGYPANRVAAQSPAPGTRVRDTGAPELALTLRVNPAYPQKGAPEPRSPYRGTGIKLADLAVNRVTTPKRKAPKKRHAPAPRPKAKATPKRPPAFAVPGGRREPLHEPPLPTRAKPLAVWLATHRTPTDANVRHWLHQHAWIVEGARLGWWRGAAALETLIRVDRRVQAHWGIGARSEALARAALVEVERRSR
jgi:hypothetical protein